MKKWKKVVFMHKTALMDIKANNIHLYVGQKFDSSKFKLDKQGWTHEHCDDCFKRIEKNDFLFEKEGEVLCKNVVKIRQHITSDDHRISLLCRETLDVTNPLCAIPKWKPKC